MPDGARAFQAAPVPPGNPAPPVTPAPGVTPAAPAPQAGPTVSLQEAIQIAHQNHGSIAVAEESVEAARQRIRQVRTGTLPTVTGQVGYQGRGTSNLGGLFGGPPSRTIDTGQPGVPPQRVPIDVNSTSFDQGLQPRIGLNYNVFDGGLTRASVRQARAGLEGNQANLVSTRNNLAFTVTNNYLFQLRSERLLELRFTQERSAEEQLRIVEARIREGAAAEADRTFILSELRNRQFDRIQAQNDVRVAANALRNSMGLQVGPPLQLVGLREREQDLPPLETLRDTAQRARPEVIQAEAQVRVAQAGVSIARIGRLPRLDTSIGFNVNPNNPTTRSDFSFAAGLSLPIWDAGLTHAREQEARTDVQASSAQLEQVKKDIAAEVQEAYLNLVNARERLDAGRLAAEAAEVNLVATTTRYMRGAPGTDVVALIQAQIQFATASNNAISALYDLHLAQAQLNRAVGRL